MLILAADNDPKLAESIGVCCGIRWPNGEFLSTQDPNELLRIVQQEAPDVVLLDADLADGSGYALCREIRAFSDVPVIMMTSNDEVADLMVSLDVVGADDCVNRSVRPLELLARINSLVRRTRGLYPGNVSDNLISGGIRIDFDNSEVILGGNVVQLTPTEFELLRCVVQNSRLVEPQTRAHRLPQGTVTIMFSDIEHSTDMIERLGDQRAKQVLEDHDDIIRQRVVAYGGFEVKSMGDGFMMAFSSARSALQCAIAVQRAFAVYNDEHPDEPIRVRLGLHTGETIMEAGDFFGKNVILPARIAAHAEGGQVLVSALLKELTESAGDIRFGEEQEVDLEGLSGKSRVYPVVW